MPDCIFCKIARDEMPSFKIYEDGLTLAFLDINPVMPGHTLVIPKAHSSSIFDIDDKNLEHVVVTVKKVAEKIRAELRADVSILQNNGRNAEQGVDHIHFHVIPRMQGDGIRLHAQPRRMSEEQMKEVQRRLKIETGPTLTRPADIEHGWETEF